MSDSKKIDLRDLKKDEIAAIVGGEAAQGSGVYSARGQLIAPSEAAQGSGKPR